MPSLLTLWIQRCRMPGWSAGLQRELVCQLHHPAGYLAFNQPVWQERDADRDPTGGARGGRLLLQPLRVRHGCGICLAGACWPAVAVFSSCLPSRSADACGNRHSDWALLLLLLLLLLVLQVRTMLNCSSMTGAALEDDGASGTAGNHWEYRLFQVGVAAGAWVAASALVLLGSRCRWGPGGRFGPPEPAVTSACLGCGALGWSGCRPAARGAVASSCSQLPEPALHLIVC